MRILGIETSGRRGSVALGFPGAAPREFVLEDRNRHETALAPAVGRLLDAVGMQPHDLDLVAVGLGPGSYTGIRIGVTFAKMLAHVAGIDLLGLPGTEVLAVDAAAGDATTPVVVMTRAHTGRVYGAAFELGAPRPRALREVALWEPATLLAGLPSGVRVFADEATRASLDGPVAALPERVRAAGLVDLARAARAAGQPPDDPLTLLPLYLQAAAPER